jgi:thiol-disulfide isomerase/thioredoxin
MTPMRFVTRTQLAAIVLAVMSARASSLAQATHPSPADVFKRAAAALASVESVSFDAREIDGYTVGTARRPGHTHVVATRSPFRYSARLRTDDGAIMEMAVSDGRASWSSGDGQTREGIAREIMNTASADAFSSGSLFDRDLYTKALASGDLLYAGRDDVDGELCDVVAYATFMEREAGSDTRYYWISTKTGLPHSYQAWRLVRGKTMITLRWVISNIELNPVIPEATFSYRPTAADSTAAAAAPAQPRAARALDGAMLPDLAVRDRAYSPASLAGLKGKETIITFWAPWCGPCVSEMPVFKKLQDAYAGDLQIAAIAVKDSRLNIDAWIAKNPQYGFRFLIDAELGGSPTSIESYFDVNGIPVNVFVNKDGRITAHWLGYEGEAALTAKVKALMGR